MSQLLYLQCYGFWKKERAGVGFYFSCVHGNCVKCGDGQFDRPGHMQSILLGVLKFVSVYVFVESLLELRNPNLFLSSKRYKPFFFHWFGYSQ